jgi:hypothetical protein
MQIHYILEAIDSTGSDDRQRQFHAQSLLGRRADSASNIFVDQAWAMGTCMA